MKLTCPGCGFAGDIEAYLTDAQARAALVWALQAPAPLADRLMRYVGLFRPAKHALSWDRVERLLAELVEAIRRGQVERNGRAWAAPQEYWIAALDQMLAGRERLQLPLKSHGYLFEIVAALSNKAEARAETRREADRAVPRRDEPTPQPVHVKREMPAHVREQLAQFRKRAFVEGHDDEDENQG